MGQDRGRESHGPFCRGCCPTRRSASDAAAGGLLARARRGGLRADPPARPVRVLGLRQHGGGGRDGRRAGRLVRGDRAVPAPARPSGAAHGDHPEAQERDRSQPAGVRDRELPHRGDRPRPARRGTRRGAGRAVARGARAPAPGAHRGSPGGPRRSGPTLRRRGAGPGGGLPRAAAGPGAGGADRRHPARGDRRRADPPRPRRPRPGAAARLARRQPGHLCRDAGRAGAVVVAAVGRRPGDRVDLPAGARVVDRDPAGPDAPGAGCPRRHAQAARGRPPARPRGHGAGRGAQGAPADPPPGARDGGGPVAVLPRVVDRGDGRRDLATSTPAATSCSSTSAATWSTTRSGAVGSRRGWARRCRSSSTPTAASWPR